MIYVILYIYHFWLWSLVWILIRGRGRGLELTNREIISKIKLVKWRLIEIILPWEIPPPWYVFMRPPRHTQCDIPIEKRDVFKEGSADDWPISHEYLSGWGNLSRKIIPIKCHFASLIFRILLRVCNNISMKNVIKCVKSVKLLNVLTC